MLPGFLKDKVDDLMRNTMDAFDAGVAVLDKDMNVLWASSTLSSLLHLKHDPVGKPCNDIYKCECKDTSQCSVYRVLSSGKKQCNQVQLYTDHGERRYISNISTPIRNETGEVAFVLKFSVDVTGKEERNRQLLLLQKLVELMQGTLHIDRLLHLVLTCVTAGSALGFNRARLFLVDKERNIVYGKMAVGPSSPEEAAKIWSELSSKYERLEDIIHESDYNYRSDTPLHMITRLMAYSLADEKEIIVSCLRNKIPVVERNAFHDPDINKKFVSMIGANEFVCVPLVVRNEAIGVICADNIYSGEPITDHHVQLLSAFANHAALAIENAEAYKKLGQKVQQLKETQERLVRSERLAVLGNMAAYIAHEIRNPLVTIGGFARTITRTPHLDSQIKKSLEIIVEEVNRLEKILANIMDFSKPVESVLAETQINEILENTCALMEPYFKDGGIRLMKKFDAAMPVVSVDPTQMKQVFVNLIKNAVESMPTGGILTIETIVKDKTINVNISDTGEGMTAEIMQNIFVPFFTTKVDGTGVGLAVSQKIVDDHGGNISVNSSIQEGTTFTISLPIKKA